MTMANSYHALQRLELAQGWQLTAAAGPIPSHYGVGTVPAEVPGCVHTDLLRAGIIPDPYLDNNEAALAWIGLVDWNYALELDWQSDGHERHDLVFEGVDTVATISLNGTVLANVENQHRSYRLAVDGLLRDGANRLAVAFKAPVPFANQRSMELGSRPRPYPLPYEAIRKSACNFGWDWGIATFTSGLWKPVRLESWSLARLSGADVVARPSGAGGVIDVAVRVERSGGEALALFARVSAAGKSIEVPIAADAAEARVALELDSVDLWWPVGFGAQALTDVTVELLAPDSHVIDVTTRKVGFRTVEWDSTPDEKGTPFVLKVNGVSVFVKGVNWIPDDALPVRVDRARLQRRLDQAVDANLNLIRVWGGGLYESDEFYELCDERGLLTWQDFLFACAAYPEEEPLRSQVESEARENVARIAHHASLVLLTGCNENLWGYEDWGWQPRLDGKTWGAYYYYDLLPTIVSEVAPHVPYVPGSPFSPGNDWVEDRQVGPHPNSDEHGTAHLWEQWNRQDWHTYRDHTPRFVAEFGWQGPPTWTTLHEYLSDSPLTPESPGMLVHQKAMEGNVKLEAGLVPHLKVPADFESWHWAMQLNQAVAVRTALEHFRSWAPHTMGAIVWQLNDCWPVTSWAAIDSQERVKPLFYGLKAAFEPRLVSIQPREGGLVVALSNDTSEAWTGALTLQRMSFDGEVKASVVIDVVVEPHSTQTVAVSRDLSVPENPSAELVAARLGDRRGTWFFAEARDSELAPSNLSVDVKPSPSGSSLVITAHNLVRDLTVLADKVAPDAHAHGGLITLLPGETVTIDVSHSGDIEPQSWLSPGVIHTMNHLVKP